MAKPRRSKLASLLAGLALSLGVSAFVGPLPGLRRHSPVPQAVATEEVPVAVASEDFQALRQTPLRRASDGAEVALTSLWSEDEKVTLAMVFYANHFEDCLKNNYQAAGSCRL